MITLRTTTEKTFTEPKGVNALRTGHIFLRMTRPEFINSELITVHGFYYYLDDEGESVKLREISITPIRRSEVHAMQDLIPPFGSEKMFDLAEYLLEKLAIIKIQQEAVQFHNANWGITGIDDIELYVPEEEPNEEEE